jgi:hypothetical protein
MTRAETKFAEAFGIPPISEVVQDSKEIVVAEPEVSNDTPRSVDSDFEFVRGTLYKLLENGATAFEQLAEIARVEEKISAYGTMNEMLSNLSDISIKLLEIHEKKNKIVPAKDNSNNTQNITNNNVYIGTASELDKLLDKGDIIDV